MEEGIDMCHNRAALRTADDVLAYVGRICFKTGPPGSVGIESEWIVTDRQDPRRTVGLERLRGLLAALDPLPARSLASLEPGGQVELSTDCAPDLATACSRLAADLGCLDRAAADRELALTGLGLDPLREPPRLLTEPRYAAMEAYFARSGEAGRTMMTGTASLQVCLDIGRDATDAAHRWWLANALTPVLVAAFANSPLHRDRPTGWRSTRQAVWSQIDPARTRPPACGDPLRNDPVQAWTRYALDAPVMRNPGDSAPHRDGGHRDSGEHRDCAPPPRPAQGTTFGDWLADGNRTGAGGPTEEDLDYHLSTLFPPVRPRGWLELRAIDAQAPAHWPVPVAVATTVLDDRGAADAAAAACEPVAGMDLVAARDGVENPRLARAAAQLFEAALGALPRLGAPAGLRRLVETYADRYVAARRCPADDVLDAWYAGHPAPATADSRHQADPRRQADRHEEVLAWSPSN